MIKIYHNPRCKKSREGLKLIEESNTEFTIHKYLKDNLSYLDLLQILRKLNIKPIDLVRKNEPIWKEKFKGKYLTDEQIINAMISFPKLIERPIVIKSDQAVIGRPASRIIELLNS